MKYQETAIDSDDVMWLQLEPKDLAPAFPMPHLCGTISWGTDGVLRVCMNCKTQWGLEAGYDAAGLPIWTWAPLSPRSLNVKVTSRDDLAEVREMLS